MKQETKKIPKGWKTYSLKNNVQFLKGFDDITKVIDNYFKDAPSVLDDSYKIKIGEVEVEFTVLDSLDVITTLKNENIIYSQLRARAGVLVSNLLSERFFVSWESSLRRLGPFQQSVPKDHTPDS